MRAPYRKWIKPFEAQITWTLILAFCIAQLPATSARAAGPGTTTVSAGSAPPPSATTVESFQPDLFTGRATAGVPIEVPPGRKNMQPQVALSYSSSGRNGWLGVGWGLEMGYIERSTKYGVPKYNDSDVFAFQLGGGSSEMVKLPDGTYRAEDEGLFMKFENLGTNGWQVTDKSGTKYLLGRTSSSRIENGLQVFRWCLDKVIDPNGNTMTLAYEKSNTVVTTVQEIRYTGHEPSGLAPANRVVFYNESRSDVSASYRGGFEMKMNRRLCRIETYATVDGVERLAARYNLSYRASTRTGQSLLASVTQVGSDGTTSLPPRTFTYQESDAPTYTVNLKRGTGSQVAWNVRSVGLDTGHENFGCVEPYSGIPYGSPVVVSNSCNVGGVSVSVGSNGSIAMSAGQDNFVHAWTAVYVGTDRTITLTRAGSGDVEFCIYIESGGSVPIRVDLGNVTLRAGWSIIHLVAYHQHQSYSCGLANALATQVDLMTPNIVTEPQMAGDMDGNGINDLVNFKNGTWNVSLASSAGTLAPPQAWLSGFGDSGYAPLVGDWNADGRTDVAVYSNGVWKFALSTGSNFTANALSSATFGSGKPLAGDFNGDGVVDLGTFSDGQWKVAVGSGSNFSAATSFDTYMSEGAAVLAPNDPRWYVRAVGRDCSGEYCGLLHPLGYTCNCNPPFPSAQIFGPGSSSFNGASITIGSDGRLRLGAPKDVYAHAWIWIYLRTAKSVTFARSGANERAAAVYVEQNGSFSGPYEMPSSPTIPFNAGWSKVHATTYNENDDDQSVNEIPLAFTSAFDIISPNKIEENVSTAQHVTGDFNGDGLTDVAVIKDQVVYPALSTGSQLVRTGPWSIPFGDKEYTTADYNGDGMTDIAWYDRSTGKVKVVYSTGSGLGTTAELPLTFTLRLAQDQIQVGEWNGDGLPDLCIIDGVSGDIEMAYSSGTAPDLLKKVDNGLGGVGELTYLPSTRMVNDFLPMVLPLVTETRASDGLGDTNATTYVYSKGLYDSGTKEFRGFGHVEVRDFEQTACVTDFHQDYQKKGRVSQTAVYDVSGNTWKKQVNTYSAGTPYAGLSSFFTHLDQSDSYIYDGDLTFKHVRMRHTYDAYGNLTGSYADGDTETTGDEKATLTTFNVNTNAWIVNTASLIQTLDASSNVVAQVRMLYDGATNAATAPVKGNLTSEERWLNLPTSQWIGARITCDAYGNPSLVTDPLGRSTTNAYDLTGTFLTSAASPLGHRRTMTYDPRNGHVLTVKDQNNVVGISTYDPLGRKTAEAIVDPSTGQTNVQAEMEYRVSSVPCRIKTTAYTQTGKGGPLVSYVFMDGWGRKVQVRQPAEEAGKQSVTGAGEYDGKGQMVKQWTAYFDTFSEDYVPAPVASLASPEEYTYDPIGRLISTKTSAGALSTIAYSDWVTTYTDAKGNVRRLTTDAFGRVILVEEVNGGATYSTRYTYDANNHLVKIRDHFGNETSVTYDSLGRKIATDDANVGHWTYEYNAKNLMTKQTDARGVVIQFSYDAMDRLLRKDYTPAGGIDALTSAVYTYDEVGVPFSTGRLTRMTDASGTAAFAYDFMNRVVKETRIVDGTTNHLQSAYDFMGRLTNFAYPNGHAARYAYNAAGGVETVSLQAGATTYPLITNITYNAAGKVTRIAYGNGMVSDYTYNPQSLKIDHKRTVTAGGVVLQDLGYTRDAVGNIESITDTVNTGTQTFQYDALNRLTQATGASYGTQSFAYDAIGNLTTKAGMTMTYGSARPHAVTATSSGLAMTYDANGNMTGKVSTAKGRLAMTYDAENRLAQAQISSQAPDTASLAPGWNLVSFPKLGASTPVTNALKQFGTAYDQVTRLNPQSQKFESAIGVSTVNQFSAVSPGEGFWVYCTNAAGATMNLPTVAGTPGAKTLTNGWYVLSAPDRTMSVAQWLSGLVSGTDYGQVKGFNSASQTLSAVDQVMPGAGYCVQILRGCSWTPPAASTSDTVRFVYDADGGRVKKTSSAGTTLFIGVAYEARGTNFTEYVLNGADRVASLDSAGALRYYLTDHLNSANVVVDPAGQVVELAEYAPYGLLSRRSGTMDTPFKFTGQRLDAESGLYFMNARYYDPELGRFAAPDMVVSDSFDPQTLNRYSYARNNPILFTDPSGNIFIIDDILIPMLIAAAIGAAVSAAMAAIMGGDVGQAALTGAVTGAITWGFGAIGESLFTGAKLIDYIGRGLINAVGSAAGGAAGAAIKGEPIGKAALDGFKMSIIMSSANYIVGQFSGYTKEGQMMKKPGGKTGDGIKNDIHINGINTPEKGFWSKGKYNLGAEDLAKDCDEFIYNVSNGSFLDVVECAQEILFGPSSFSRELGGYMQGLSGQTVNIVCHSQGTIMTTRALQLAGRGGTRFAADSTITFNNPPIDAISAYGAAWSCGISKIAYVPDARDFVSAIGTPVFIPTSIPFIPKLGTYHCAYSFESQFY